MVLLLQFGECVCVCVCVLPEHKRYCACVSCVSLCPCLEYAQALDQQEGEYETELQQLTAAANAEINSERENIGKLRAILQVVKSYDRLNILPNNKGVGVAVISIAIHTQVESGKLSSPPSSPPPPTSGFFVQLFIQSF